MTQRMHPQDLRAIVAACMLGNSSEAVSQADTLLAEVERTAKPEGSETWTYAYLQHRAASAKARLMAIQNEAAIASIREEEAAFERERIIAKLWELGIVRVENPGKLRQLLTEDSNPEQRKKAGRFRTVGAREERDRIIRMLDMDGDPDLVLTRNGFELYGEDLRRALRPDIGERP